MSNLIIMFIEFYINLDDVMKVLSKEWIVIVFNVLKDFIGFINLF